MTISLSAVRLLRRLWWASWLTFAVSLGLHLFIRTLDLVAGCPPAEHQSSSLPGRLSLLPPGVTCRYELPEGTLVTGDEWWAPVLIAASLVTAVVLTKVLEPGRRTAG